MQKTLQHIFNLIRTSLAMRIACLTILMFNSAMLTTHAQVIDMSGEWQFQLDPDNVGEKEGWQKNRYKLSDKITLPASIIQQMKGNDISVNTKWVGSLYDSSYYHNPYMEKYRKPGKDMKLPFFLTPDKHYVGKAWYKKTVIVPKGEIFPFYTLYLERPHIVTEVWVNGDKTFQQLNYFNSLSVPHKHLLLGFLKPGENTICIRVDNDPETVKVGIDSHSVTDQTQGCWNGIVGKIELRPFNHVTNVQVYPDVDSRMAHVSIDLQGTKDNDKATVKVKAVAFNTDKTHTVTAAPQATVVHEVSSTHVDFTLDMGKDMLLWDEFNPQLYRLEVEVNSKERGTTRTETVFGMRKIEMRDKMFYINDREVQLRGTVENCCFPNTGYPPTDLESWLKLFKTCKSYGLNHMRFHTYCPPEAAFLAADMTGFYIQPEGPSWPNHGVKLGRGEYIDNYLMEEGIKICDEYGNHPSFTFFAFGNEPAGNWVPWSTEHVAQIKKHDTRHLYCGFSVGGGWAWQPGSEFAVKAGARGLNEWAKKAPESTVNFAQNITTYNGKDMPGTPIEMPFVSHETGQWCAFPNFDEMGKYTGPNRAKNFEIFRDLLNDNGMGSRAKDFLMASGKLQALCYKAEIERTLRTPKYAGYQLLSLNDYSGQGTALVGVTDVFFDNKGYISAEAFREFSGPVVPLARIPKFTYNNTENFEAGIEINQHSNGTLAGVKPHWEITRAVDTRKPFTTLNLPEPIAQGDFAQGDIPVGSNFELGRISVPLNQITEATKLTFTVTIPGTEACNHWDFWVYPEKQKIASDTAGKKVKLKRKEKRKSAWFDGNIYVTDSLDIAAKKVLKNGGKVFIMGAGKVQYGKEVIQQFTPVFWNTSWFKMRPPHTTGIFVENQHSIFELFPTDSHSDMQWWELVNRAQVMQFTDFPKDFQPIVQSIDTWFVSRKIGMLFEAKVGNGKLVMTTMDLSTGLNNRHAARQMKASILNYMNSDKFQPQWTIDEERVADLFTKVAGEVNMYTNDSPDELKPALLAPTNK